MPVFELTSRISFPPPEFADRSGLLAMGGGLESERLLLAYRTGIFPWYDNSTPILWWSPDPRMVLFVKNLHIPKSLKKKIRKNYFKVTMDTCFEAVITECAYSRIRNGEETWITDELIDAYTRLHNLGYAHSVEVWSGNELAGGLYGVSLGRIFFGESMFTKKDDASKTGFVYLVRQLEKWSFPLIDCQVSTDNLSRFNAEEISRKEFLKLIDRYLGNYSDAVGKWDFDKDLKLI
ncbi:MAG: leucyl/phenylalanyl-tRNA--protein transferase [Thermodesulfobacteriota bacterium]